MRLFRLSFGLRAVYLAASLLLAGNAMQNIYIPTRAVELGFGPLGVSLLGSLYFLGFIVGCLTVPHYLFRVGHVRTFSAFAGVAAISALLTSLTDLPALWLPLRLVTGFSLAALYLSVESWISAFSQDGNRGRIISIYRLTDLAGSVCGQVLLFGVAGSPSILTFVSIFFMLSLMPLTLTQIQMPQLVETVPEKLYAVFKRTQKMAPVSFWGALMSGTVSGIFWSLIPLFVVALGFSGSRTPLVVACYLIGGAISQWPIGNWSDRIDRRVVILGLSGASIVVSILLTMGARSGVMPFPALLLLLGIFGAAGVPIYAISMAHANDWIKKTSVVDISVLLLVSSSIGSVLGPVVAGLALNYSSPKNLFLIILIGHCFLFSQVLYRIAQVRGLPTSEKTGYVDLPETTPMIATVATPEKP